MQIFFETRNNKNILKMLTKEFKNIFSAFCIKKFLQNIFKILKKISQNIKY